MVFPPQPSGSLIVVGWPCPEGHFPIIPVIQTHPSCRFHLVANFSGLRRNGSSSQVINQVQDFPEQLPRHRHLGQLERDVPAMADTFGSDLDHP